MDKLTPRDLTYLETFLPCVTDAERTQLGLPYRQSATISTSLSAALRRLIASPPLPPARRSVTYVRTIRRITKPLCPGAHRIRYAWVFGDTAVSPTRTPLQIAADLAPIFNTGDRDGAKRNAQFAVAVAQGRLLHDGDAGAVSFGVYVVSC